MQFPVKQMSREMAKPKVGSWKRMKKIARYLLIGKEYYGTSKGKRGKISLRCGEIVIAEDARVPENRLHGVWD